MRAIIVFFLSCLMAQIASAQESRFYLLNMKCQGEEAGEVETSPQSPPLNVDDPGTPGCNKWEINALFDGDISKSTSNWETPLLDINYGIGDNLQLKYEVPYLKNQVDSLALEGVGTSKAGIKYLFFNDEERELEIAIYPQVDFATPGSQATKNGLAAPGSITTIPFLVGKKLGHVSRGPLNFTANLGYNFSSRPDTANFVSASAGLGMPLFRKISIMGEVSTEQALSVSEDGTREALVKANLGALATINREFLIYGSVGQSLYASDQLNHTYVLAGVRLLTSSMPWNE